MAGSERAPGPAPPGGARLSRPPPRLAYPSPAPRLTPALPGSPRLPDSGADCLPARLRPADPRAAPTVLVAPSPPPPVDIPTRDPSWGKRSFEPQPASGAPPRVGRGWGPEGPPRRTPGSNGGPGCPLSLLGVDSLGLAIG